MHKESQELPLVQRYVSPGLLAAKLQNPESWKRGMINVGKYGAIIGIAGLVGYGALGFGAGKIITGFLAGSSGSLVKSAIEKWMQRHPDLSNLQILKKALVAGTIGSAIGAFVSFLPQSVIDQLKAWASLILPEFLTGGTSSGLEESVTDKHLMEEFKHQYIPDSESWSTTDHEPLDNLPSSLSTEDIPESDVKTIMNAGEGIDITERGGEYYMHLEEVNSSHAVLDGFLRVAEANSEEYLGYVDLSPEGKKKVLENIIGNILNLAQKNPDVAEQVDEIFGGHTKKAFANIGTKIIERGFSVDALEKLLFHREFSFRGTSLPQSLWERAIYNLSMK